jgi:hypothetical protein
MVHEQNLARIKLAPPTVDIAIDIEQPHLAVKVTDDDGSGLVYSYPKIGFIHPARLPCFFPRTAFSHEKLDRCR